ncbi:MAG: IPT/TIG domain-containing protein [Elusimicrobiota bacterium]
MVNLAVDGDAPLAAFQSPVERGWLGAGSHDASLTLTDPPVWGFPGAGVDTTTVHLLLDNNALSGLSFSGSSVTASLGSPSHGQHILEARFADFVANSSSAFVSFGVDTIPPDLTVAPTGPYVLEARPVLTALLSDHDSGASSSTLKLRLDGNQLAAEVYIPSGGGAPGPWQAAADMPGMHMQAASVMSNGRLYVAGGINESWGITSVVRYAQVLPEGGVGEWHVGPPLLTAVTGARMVASGNRIYVLGGNNGSSMSRQVFYSEVAGDGTMGAWQPLPDMPFDGGTGYFGVASVGGYIYVMGGNNWSCQLHNKVYFAKICADGLCYPGNESEHAAPWAPTTVLPLGITAFSSAASEEGLYVYVPGGAAGCGTGAQSQVYYNPINSNGTLSDWHETSSLPRALTNHLVLASGGYLFAMGGNDGGAYFNSVYYAKMKADYSLEAWETAENVLPANMNGIAGGAWGGRLYIAGGAAEGYPSAQVHWSQLPIGDAHSVAARFLPMEDIVEGSHQLSAEGADFAGNTSNAQASFTLDLHPPTLAVLIDGVRHALSGYAAVRSERPVLRLEYSDAGSGVNPATARILVDGNDLSNQLAFDGGGAQLVVSTPLAQGKHTLEAAVSDHAGRNASMRLDLLLDSLAPQVAVSTPTDGSFVSTRTPAMMAGYSDEGSGLVQQSIQLLLDGATVAAQVSLVGAGSGGTPGPWTPTTTMPGSHAQPAYATLDGHLYIAGGIDENWALSNKIRFAPIMPGGGLGAWQRGPDIPFSVTGARMVATAHRLFLLGGNPGGGMLSQVYYSDIDSQGMPTGWHDLPSMPFAGGVGYFGAAAAGGYIYVMGGHDASCTVHNAVYYTKVCDAGLCNPKGSGSNVWELTEALPLGITFFSNAASDDGLYVYVPGGATGCGGGLRSDVWYSAPGTDGALGEWTATTPLPHALSNHLVLTSGEYLYAMGGNEGASYFDTVFYAKMDATNHSLGAWETAANALPGRMNGIGGGAWDGRLYIAGGAVDGYVSGNAYFSELPTGKVVSASATYTPPTPLLEGRYELRAEALDLVGNLGLATSTFRLDLTPPLSTLAALGTSRTHDGTLYVGLGGSVTVSATDLPLSSGSGVAASYLGVGEEEMLLSSAPLRLADGLHAFSFYSMDFAGNAESTKTAQAYFDSYPPATVNDLSIASVFESSITLSWSEPTDQGAGLESFMLARASEALTEANFIYASTVSVPSPVAPGTRHYVTLEGVGSSAYAALKAMDKAGNLSALSGVMSFVRSTVTVGGAPELGFTANQPVTAALVETTQSTGVVVLAAAVEQRLEPVASIYNLGPEGATFDPPAMLVFRYSTQTLADMGLTPSDVAIYHYENGTLVRVEPQTRDEVAQTVSAPISHIASIFMLAGMSGGHFALSTGPIGMPFTLTGSGFGTYDGANTRVKFGTTLAPLSLWNDTTIAGTVPGLAAGVYAVRIERQSGSTTTSVSGGNFTVLTPSVASLAPSSAPIGAPFTLTGTAFGPYNGANTVALFNGTTASLSVWNDTTITGTVPGIVPGAVEIVLVRRTSDGGSVTSAPMDFTVVAPSIESVVPSSGPIGITLNVIGTGFGPYDGAATVLLVGGTPAPLSLWNDTTITGTVPGLTAGQHGVVVRRTTADGGLIESSTVYFQVTDGSVASLMPSTGPVGVPFTITGTSFGAYDGANTRVRFGTTLAPLSVWNDTTITGTIPGLTVGSYAVTVERQQGESVGSAGAGTFIVQNPVVSAVSPSSAPIGSAFTLTGAGFGPYNGSATQVLFGGVAASLSVWNDTTITGVIPGALSTGQQTVVVRRTTGDGGSSESAPVSFLVTGAAIAGMTPSAAPIGTPFTITGSDFGAYDGANTRVKFGATLAALSVWNDTTISGTVPGISTGTCEVVVERQQGGGVTASNAFSFTRNSPAVTDLAPSSAPIGAPFTITGSGFGPYNGANTRVRFGDLVAALSVWNDTTISGTVPGAAAVGATTLLVERLTADGGYSAAEPQAFEVLAPHIDVMDPLGGLGGTAFSLTGGGFGPYSGAATRVLFDGAPAALSVWQDHRIVGVVPDGLSTGEHQVLVERAPTGGVVQSNAVVFTVGTPVGGAALGSTSAAPLSARPAWHFEARLPVTAAEGGRVEAPVRAAVQVAPDALEADKELTIAKGRTDSAQEGVRMAAQSKRDIAPAGPAIEFGPEGTQFKAPVLIELPYSPKDLAPGQSEDGVAVHYWDPAAKDWVALLSEVDKVNKRVRARTNHFSLYQPMAAALRPSAASEEFALRDVYVFPNPARAGAKPTFHVETGLADTLGIRIYDVSGKLVHEHELAGPPGVVDDGAGPEYAFEYVWEGRIPSGVYFYAIEAKKAGQGSLRKTGKLGVVR